MEQQSLNEGFFKTMLDIKSNLPELNMHYKILFPHKEKLLNGWITLHKKHFASKSTLPEKDMKRVFLKWIDLFFEALKMKNIENHYDSMIEFGKELKDIGVSLEEIIFSLHFFEEVSMPVIMTEYPEKKKLTKIVFAIDMLFHNELACLSLAYFYRYRSEIDKLEKLKDDLTHMIVHDLKNPLNAVSAAAESIRDDLTKNMSVDNAQYMEIILSAAKNMWEMVNNLLDINKIENNSFVVHREPENIVLLIEKIIKDMTPRIREKNIKISFSKVNVPLFSFDKEVVRRIIINLLDNAFKFSPQGGTIRIKLTERKDRITILVSDMGPGIKKADRERIFEKFGQAGLAAEGKIHGTGLGLAFCKMAVESSGGKIRVLERFPGTTFSFYLPLIRNSNTKT